MKNVVRFWRAFEQKAEQLRDGVLKGRHRWSFEEVGRLLDGSGFDYCFDLTEVDGSVWLIFSPEGDVRIASEIDQLVADAPRLPGWRVFGRRQKSGLRDALVFVSELYGRDVSTASVSIVPSGREKVALKFYSAALEGLTPGMRDGLVRTLLDHLIGEDALMRYVSAIETVAQGSGAIPISELEQAVLRVVP